MSDLPNVFLLQFAPEDWSSLGKLQRFAGPPLPDNGNVHGGLRDCGSHLEKVEVFWGIAEKLRPNLALDRAELERLGGTSNQNSREYAAVCESVVLALYSAIDGVRTFIYGAYPKVQGVQKGSNEDLFKRAKECKYGAGFPEAIRAWLAEDYEEWFTSLRTLRTVLSHGATGSCHLDNEAGNIRYFNEGLRKGPRANFIEDIEATLRLYQTKVTELIEAVAQYHLALLQPVPVFQMCGTYKARWYSRMVSYRLGMTIQNGQCMSYDWFETETGYYCPLASQCDAYQRKWPAGSATVVAGGKFGVEERYRPSGPSVSETVAQNRCSVRTERMRGAIQR